MVNWKLCGIGLAAALLSSAGARADLIDVQFGENSSGGAPLFGGPTPAYVGAGVLGAPGDQWNQVTSTFRDSYIGGAPWGRTGSNIPLFDASGTPTGVSLSYATTNAFIDLSGLSPIFDGSPYQNLLTSFMFSDGNRVVSPGQGSDGPGSVTLSGLISGNQYELILYSVADAPGRSTLFTVNGASATVTPTNSQTLSAGGNYAEFMASADVFGDIDITFAENGTASGFPEGDLNGIQLLDLPAVPEPSSALALLGGLGAMLGLLGSSKLKTRAGA